MLACDGGKRLNESGEELCIAKSNILMTRILTKALSLSILAC